MGSLGNIIKAGTKKYGGNVFLKASSAPCDFPRLPSGIFAFDYCVTGDMELQDAYNGKVLKFRDIVEGKLSLKTPSYTNVFRYGQGYDYEPCEIIGWFDLGLKPCVSVITDMGVYVEVGETHKFLTPEGWVAAASLKKGDQIVRPRAYYWPFGDNQMDMDLIGKFAPTKVIPDYIFSLRKNLIKELIIGMWMGDGSVSETRRTARYSTTSYQMAKQVQFLLARFGIFSKVYGIPGGERAFPEGRICKTLKNYPKNYSVFVDGDYNIRKFYREFALTGKKGSRLKYWDENPAMGKGRCPLFIKNKYGPDSFLDTVKSVSSIGKQRVYDITVDGHSNYILEGLVSHNCAAGGIPVGASSCLWGPYSSGKSYIAQKIVANAQYICFKCFNYIWDCKCATPDTRKSVYLDVEGAMDWSWARSIGVPEDLTVVSGLIGEEYVDVFHSAIRADDVGLIVVDSLASLVPATEMEGSAIDKYVMTTARLVTYMVRKGKTLILKERRRGHHVAVLIINQVRMKIALPGQSPEETPGGNASKHDYTLSVRTGRRAVKDKDSGGLPMHTTTSLSLASAMGKRKLLVLAGAAQFDVSSSFEHEFTRGTPLEHAVILKYVLDKEFLVKTTKGYTLSIPGREPLGVKTQRELLDTWYDDDHLYLSIQKGIIDAEKKKRLEKDNE